MRLKLSLHIMLLYVEVLWQRKRVKAAEGVMISEQHLRANGRHESEISIARCGKWNRCEWNWCWSQKKDCEASYFRYQLLKTQIFLPFYCMLLWIASLRNQFVSFGLSLSSPKRERYSFKQISLTDWVFMSSFKLIDERTRET